MKAIKISLFFLFLGISNYAIANDDPFLVLLNAKSIKCYWDKGATANWIKGTPEIKIEQWNPLKEDSYVIFDSIDIKTGTARAIAQGAGDVMVLTTAKGITFIEQTPSGNLSIVTVFATYENNSNKFIAVMSRHMDMPQTPFPQQYYGTAEILE